MASPGNRPVLNPDGSYLGPATRDIMADRRATPTLREGLALGIGKAHRSVVYAHYEFRNYDRSYLGETGKL